MRDSDDLAALIDTADLFTLQPSAEAMAMSQIGGGEDAVQTEPEVMVPQYVATGDDAIGFVQVGQDQIIALLLLCEGDRLIQLAGSTRQLTQLAPGARQVSRMTR